MRQARRKHAIVLLLIPSLLFLAFTSWARVTNPSVTFATICWAAGVLVPLVCLSELSAIRWGWGEMNSITSLRRRMAGNAIAAAAVAIYVLGFAIWPQLGDKAYNVFATGAGATAIATLFIPSWRAPSFALFIGVALMFVLFAKGW